MEDLRRMTDPQGNVSYHRVLKVWDKNVWEQCEFDESKAADSIPTKYVDWSAAKSTYTFHRADRSTRGRTVNAGPRTIWLRKRD